MMVFGETNKQNKNLFEYRIWRDLLKIPADKQEWLIKSHIHMHVYNFIEMCAHASIHTNICIFIYIITSFSCFFFFIFHTQAHTHTHAYTHIYIHITRSKIYIAKQLMDIFLNIYFFFTSNVNFYWISVFEIDVPFIFLF